MTTSSRLAAQVFDTRQAMGAAAADLFQRQVQDALQRQPNCRVVFGSAPSQDEFLTNLAAHAKDSPELWQRVEVFHMDEYVGMPGDDPRSFRAYLQRTFLRHVGVKEFHGVRGEAPAPEIEAIRYASLLAAAPIDIVALGVGENGHVAFNDPPVANFTDPLWAKVVEMAPACRQQQVNDGCFADLASVPRYAITITLRVFLEAKSLVGVVPGSRKANAVLAALCGPVGSACPATVLRVHRQAALFMDRDSAALLPGDLNLIDAVLSVRGAKKGS